MTPLPACFICGAEILCCHRESELIGWYYGTLAPRAIETPVSVVTMPEPAETPQSAPVEEIRQLAKQLRRKRGW